MAGGGCPSLGAENSSQGYRLQFASRPPKFNGVLDSVASGDSAQVLEGEISSLLSKGATDGEIQEGFYSRYFTVPKRGGGLRPILDLRVLNGYLRKYKFGMLTLTVLSRAIRPDNWFTSIDLQDAYFHIHIYPAHRKFLRFAYQGIAHEYMALSFGLSLALRVFTKCVEAALNLLRDSGLRIHSYIDDYLLCSHSEALSARDSATLLTHLTDLGFRISYTKSCLRPTQRIEYLGIMIDSVCFRATLTDRRREKFHLCLSLFSEGRTVAFKTCLSLLGLMASLLAVVPLGHEHHDGGLYKPPGWDALPAAAQTGSQHDNVEQCAFSVSARDARPGQTEHRSRSPVKRKSRLRRMGPQPPGSGTGMGEIRPGVRRSLRIAGKRTMSSVLFCLIMRDDAPLAVDGLAHPWPNALLYAFPPLCLISPTLERVREQCLSIILIAPRWPGKHWLAEIVQLLSAQPWPLPLRRDLLSQANGEIFHPHPDRMALWAWPVRG